MGKCVSKDQHLQIREIDERAYIALSDGFDYYGREYEVRTDDNHLEILARFSEDGIGRGKDSRLSILRTTEWSKFCMNHAAQTLWGFTFLLS